MRETLQSGWRRSLVCGLAASMWLVSLGTLTAEAQDVKNQIKVRPEPRVETLVDKSETTVEQNDAAVVFTNSTPINFPADPPGSGTGNPYPSTISVTGLTGTITDINVRMNGFTHTFPDDVALLLVSPDGRKFVLQSDVGGGTDVTNVTYTFDDQSPNVIGNSGPFPANNTTVRPSSVGDDDEMPAPAPGLPYQQPAPAGSATLNGVFGGINPNGTWQLFTIDFFDGDTGTFSGGWALDITTSAPPPPNPKPCFDFFGSGRTSFATIGVSGNELVWRLQNNGGAGAETVFYGAAATDFATPGYFDGDNRADINVWRPGASATYFVRPSTAPTTILGVQWGTTGDLVQLEADYDGDGRDDPTVGRNVGGNFNWFYLRSGNNTLGAVQFGSAATDVPLPGADYNGDGRADITVIRFGVGADTYLVGDSNTGALILSRTWGEFNTDFYVVGDYVGDARADFAVWRGAGSGTNGVWYIQENGGAGAVSSAQWGQGGTQTTGDLPVCGDYNGDGKSDIAVYRRSARTFYWINSGATPTAGTQAISGASPDDIPVGRLKAR